VIVAAPRLKHSPAVLVPSRRLPSSDGSHVANSSNDDSFG